MLLILPSGQFVENVLKIAWKLGGEFHSAAVARMCEREASGVQERPLKMRDGADVPWHAAMDTAVQGIADDRVTDGTEVDADLVCASGMNRHVAERETG